MSPRPWKRCNYMNCGNIHRWMCVNCVSAVAAKTKWVKNDKAMHAMPFLGIILIFFISNSVTSNVISSVKSNPEPDC